MNEQDSSENAVRKVEVNDRAHFWGQGGIIQTSEEVISELRPECQIFYTLQKVFMSMKFFAPTMLKKIACPPLLNHALGICEGSLKCHQ